MTDPQLAMVMLGIMLIIIMLGFPIAFSLLALGLFFGFYAMEFRIFDLMVEKTNEVMTNDVLVALPLFLFMGYMVERANILDRLFRSIQVAARHVPGLDRGGGAGHLRAVRDRDRHRRRRGYPHGRAGVSRHAARELRPAPVRRA